MKANEHCIENFNEVHLNACLNFDSSIFYCLISSFIKIKYIITFSKAVDSIEMSRKNALIEPLLS